MTKVVQLPINDANMISIVRRLSQNSESVCLKKHAKQRMKQRGITFTQVLACLRCGVIDEPAHESIQGDWKCTIRHQHAGEMVRVAVAIERNENEEWVAVVTVF